MAETVTKTIGRVGPLDRGVYAPDTTYNAGDFVLYEESTYICKVDGTIDITPGENDNWQYFAKGIDPDTTEVTDKYGVTDSSPTPGGTSQKKTLLQTWIDSAADKIINKLLATDKFQDTLKQYLVNNGSTTGEGFALDARYGKTLQDSVNQLNSGLQLAILGKSIEITTNTDWDTITDAGVYKVQGYNGLSADKHAPLGMYNFGTLIVLKSAIQHENRIVQIYIPDNIQNNDGANTIAWRSSNAGDFHSWVYIIGTQQSPN